MFISKMKLRQIFRRVGKSVLWLLVSLLVLSVFSAFSLRYVSVRVTPLMLIRVVEQWRDGKSMKMDQEWVSIDKISAQMITAVIASEDNLFLAHNGFDFEAIKKARKLNEKGKTLYGASTISQQTAKNVFLWPSRSWFRKAIEAYMTLLLETFNSKQRIMEIYLNVVELGDGIYGVESASQYYYNHSASKLTRSEAAMLAACLPAPLKSDPKNPSSKLTKKQIKIMNSMHRMKKTGWGR